MLWQLVYEDEGQFTTETFEGTCEELEGHIENLCEMGCCNFDIALIIGERRDRDE